MYDSNPRNLGAENCAQAKAVRGISTSPREVGEIGRQAQRLESRISSLAVSLDALTMRLDPILNYSEVSQEKLAGAPCITEMGQFIETSNSRLDDLISRVEDLTSRIAL